MKYSNRFIQIARILSLVLIIASIAGCKKNTAAAGGEGDDIVYAVNTYKIEKGNLDQYLEFGGDVASVSAVDVLPDMSGKISRVLSNIGDTVAKDQVIAYVDASRPGMSYSESPVRAPVSGRIITSMPSVGATVSQTMPVVQIGSTDRAVCSLSRHRVYGKGRRSVSRSRYDDADDGGKAASFSAR